MVDFGMDCTGYRRQTHVKLDLSDAVHRLQVVSTMTSLIEASRQPSFYFLDRFGIDFRGAERSPDSRNIGPMPGTGVLTRGGFIWQRHHGLSRPRTHLLVGITPPKPLVGIVAVHGSI